MRWQELLVLDCTGALHVAPDTPLELHVTTPLKWFAELLTNEARARARCQRNATCPTMPDDVLEALHVPGVPMILNLLRPYAERLYRPAQCAAGAGFASSFFSDAPVAALGFDRFALDLPPSCTYESFASKGAGCKFAFTEPVSRTRVNVAVDTCPGSTSTLLPFVSVSVAGDWAGFLGHPCSSVGASTECGGFTPPGGGAPLVCKTYSDDPDELWGVAKRLRLVRSDFNTGGLAACGGKGELARRLRVLLHAAFRLPPPTDALAPVAFCLPTSDTLRRVGDWFSGTGAGQLAHTVAEDVAARPNAPAHGDTRACLAAGCDLRSVGNGVCDMACYSTACRWDGGDCVSNMAAVPPFVSPRMKASRCRIPLANASASFGAVTSAAQIAQNVWAPCNGLTSQCTESLAACACPVIAKPPSLPTGPLCAGYMQGSLCFVRFGVFVPCAVNESAVQRRLVGAGAALSAWDGVLPDGNDALDADRKSGARWPLPDTWVDVGEASLAAALVQIAHVGCSGEVGVRLGNDVLAAGAYAPHLKTQLAGLHGWVQDVAACTLASAGVPELTPEQFEVRFSLHQAAAWAYQNLPLGVRAGAGNATLQGKWAGAGGYGSRLVGEWHVLATEPDVNPWDLYGLTYSTWGRAGRIEPPDAAECSFDSAALGGATSRGDRRCRFSYIDLGDLLSVRGQRRLDAALHVDARQDRCGGAGQAGGAPMPAPDAARSLPSLAVYAETPLVSLFAAPTFCSADADCVGTGGGSFACVDPVRTFFTGEGGLAGVLPWHLQDPLALFTQGLRVDGSSQCATADTFARTLRATVRLAAGEPADGGTELKMCLPDIKGIADKAREWARTASTGCKGFSCLPLPPGLGAPCCNNASWTGTSCCSLPASRASELRGFLPLSPGAAPLAPGTVLAPDAEDALLSPVAPDARAPPPNAVSAAFVVTLTPATGARSAGDGLTNVVKTKLRRGLAWALARRGFGAVATDLIVFTGVTPVAGGAVDMGFTLSLPPGTPPAVVDALVAELTGGAPGSVGADAGRNLAWMGAVDAVHASGVAIRPGVAPAGSPTRTGSASPPAPASSSATPSSWPPTRAPSSSASASATKSPPRRRPGIVITVDITITISGITLAQATDPRVWGALRAACACRVPGLTPSLATLLTASDGTTTLVLDESDALNAPPVGGAACPGSSRGGEGSDALLPAARRRALQARAGGGEVVFTIRIVITAETVAPPEPAAGEDPVNAHEAAMQQVADSLADGVEDTATWLPPDAPLRTTLRDAFGVDPATVGAVAGAQVRTDAAPSPSAPARPGGGQGGGGSGVSDSTLLAAMAGTGVLLVGAAAVIVALRRRGGGGSGGAPMKGAAPDANATARREADVVVERNALPSAHDKHAATSGRAFHNPVFASER